MSEDKDKPLVIRTKQTPGDAITESLTPEEIQARTTEEVIEPPAEKQPLKSSSAKEILANPKKPSFLNKAKEAPKEAIEEVATTAHAVTVDFDYTIKAAESNAKLAIANGHRSISHQFQHLADVARHVKDNLTKKGVDHTKPAS